MTKISPWLVFAGIGVVSAGSAAAGVKLMPRHPSIGGGVGALVGFLSAMGAYVALMPDEPQTGAQGAQAAPTKEIPQGVVSEVETQGEVMA